MLERIVGQVRNMDSLVAEIATASGERSQGFEQVTRAITEMDKVTQSNAASAEESASAASELSSQSTQLRDAVDRFNAFSGITVAPVSSSAEFPALRRVETLETASV